MVGDMVMEVEVRRKRDKKTAAISIDG